MFPPAQLELFATEQKQNEQRNNLISSIDRIRQRFGTDAVQVGRTMAA
jgi:hypothetical protein